LRFIDSNVLFRMFAASPDAIRRYQETGTCGNAQLDYAIGLLLRLGEGGCSTSELALLETVGVASRLGGREKAETLLRAVVTQDGFQVLETRALAYPVSFAFVTTYGLEARDSLHLSVASLSGVDSLLTSDIDLAERTESVIRRAREEGFRLPDQIRTIYHLTVREARLTEEQVTRSLSLLTVDRVSG
jgi:predicted nucleic acid-binding protein